MKQLLLIFLVASLQITQITGQDKNELELTYFSKIPWERLYKAGEKFIFMQGCTNIIDSVVEGKINFRMASIASIKRCQMTMRIYADTLRYYSVETSSRKNTNDLLAETNRFYGRATETSVKADQVVYSWKALNGSGRPATTTLSLFKNGRKGILISTIE
jgi:hypothetical protein